MSDEAVEKKKPAVPVWVWILVGFLGLSLISFAFGDDESLEVSSSVQAENQSSEETSETSESSPPPAEESDPGSGGLGDTVVTPDGVEVSILEVQYGVETPNNWIIDNPKGELAAVRLEVFNGSNEQLSISSSSLVALIGEAEYEASAIFGDNGDWYVYEDLNPQLGASMTAYFDIPPGSQFSGAVFETSIIFGEEATFSF